MVASSAARACSTVSRVESNDAYQTRDNLVSISALLRLFSVVQMAYLEGFIGNRFAAADLEAGEVGGELSENLSLFVSSPHVREARVGLRTRF